MTVDNVGMIGLAIAMLFLAGACVFAMYQILGFHFAVCRFTKSVRQTPKNWKEVQDDSRSR